VKASQNFVGKSIIDIFREDLINVYNQKVSKIRPVVGANGAGKTTLLKFRVKAYLDELAPNSNILLFFDFKAITDDINKFWSVFVQHLLDQLVNEKKNVINELINKIDKTKVRYELLKLFKNKTLVDHLLKLASYDTKEHEIAHEYFYSEELDSKTIGDFFYGLVKFALQLDYTVVITFDEIQFLNEIDPSNVLLKLFSEKFIRYLMEQFSNEKLYILISCLENPDLQEWTKLKNGSKNFESIVRGKEIFLGNLTSKERDEIIQQVADKIGFEKKEEKMFISKIKSSIFFYLPRDLLKAVANVIDSMGYVGYTEYDLRQIYEEEARNYMKDKLKNAGFTFIENDVKSIGGYKIDIFASGPTKRSEYVKKAFGEASTMHKAGMKQKIEKFADWLLRMKGREYNPDKDDYAFFVCPLDRITKGSKDVLESNNIELIDFSSLNVEQILEQGLKMDKKIEKNPEEEIHKEIEIEEPKQETVIIIKDEKYKLTDIPGIGPAKEKLLNSAGIHTVKELLNCNAKMVAKEFSGLGEVSLNKWRQAAKQILNG